MVAFDFKEAIVLFVSVSVVVLPTNVSVVVVPNVGKLRVELASDFKEAIVGNVSVLSDMVCVPVNVT